MTAETAVTFTAIALFGLLMGYLIPENSTRNALRVLVTLIIAAALLKAFMFSGVVDCIKESIRTDVEGSYSKEKMYSYAAGALNTLTEETVSRITEEFTGNKPERVSCICVYDGESFVLSSVSVTVACEFPDGLRKHIALKLEADESAVTVICGPKS